jgi:hypothetical protein
MNGAIRSQPPKPAVTARSYVCSYAGLFEVVAVQRLAKLFNGFGSSGWIRTSNPPVNSVIQVFGLGGSSCR